jgi:hypothetical protein
MGVFGSCLRGKPKIISVEASSGDVIRNQHSLSGGTQLEISTTRR